VNRAQHLVLLYMSAAFAFSSVKAQTPGGLIARTPENVEATKRAERRVTLDVQVTDSFGKPLNGLSQQSFTLLDNGDPQAITSFQRIEENDQASSAEVVLVLDTMNASFQDVVIERQGMEAFLLQNRGHLALPVSIVFLADTGVKISKPSRDGNSLAEDFKKLQTPIRVLGSAQGGDGAQDRSQRSLRALQMLCTYEATRPGRKLLVWVSPGWPLLSRSTAQLSAQDQRRYFNNIVDVTTALRGAHITLYSVAPLNLAQVNGQNPLLYKAYLRGVENPTQADSPNLALQVLATHSGGRALPESGDLAGQIALCAEDGQGYYEITFDAAESDAAIQYHALQIKLDQAGALTRTSTAYYAGVPQSTHAGVFEAPATSSATTVPTPQYKVEARLVIADVTVLDKKGLPVKGLSATDFLLREDNTPQTILSFEEHSVSGDAVAAEPTDASTDGTIVVNNKPPSGSAWNVLLIDLYNTPNENRGRLQSQLEQFLKQLPEQEPVALVTMSSHIKIETSFRDGAGAAYRYLRKHGLGPVDPSTPANMVDRQDPLMPSADIAGTVVANQANVDVDRQANRAQTTLECFSALAQWLAPYPGKKNVYWLSGGFPLQGQPFGVAGYDPDSPGLGPDVNFQQEAQDSFLTNIDFAILEYDAKGKLLEKSMVKLTGKMTPAQIAHLSAKTLSTTQTIKLEAGAKTLVLGVRDNVSGRFGRVEVSLSNHQSP